MADLKFEVDSSEVSRAVDELIRMGKASKDTAKAFEQGFRKVVSWQERFQAEQGRINATLEKNYRAQTLSNKSARESASVFQQLDAEVSKAATSYSQLKAAIDPVYAAQMRMKKGHDAIRAALKAGVITRAEAAQSLRAYRNEIRSFSQAQMAATKSSNRLGVVTQQAGYQISDFIVQVQSGTNPFVAFSQQASQLVGVLPLVAGNLGLTTAAAIGLSSVLGIGIPLLGAAGAALYNMSKDGEKAEKSVDKLEERLKRLDKTLRDWLETKKLAQLSLTADELLGLGDLDAAKRDLKEALAEAAAARETFPTITRFDPNTNQMVTEVVKGSLEFREAELIVQEAMRKAELAKLRITRIQNKLSEERVLRVREEESILSENLELQRAIVKFGEESVEVKRLSASQELASYARQVALMDLTEKQKSDLISAFKKNQEELLKLQEEAAEAERTLDRIFQNRTVMYSIRFSGEEDVMSQPLTPSGKMKPKESYEELLKLGVPPERLEAMGLRPSKRGGGSSTKADPLKTLQDRIALEQELLGKTEAQQRVIQALGVNWQDYSATALSGIFETIEEMDKLNQKAAEQEQISKTIESSMNTAFMSMVDGTKSVSDAFKDMARAIIAELYQIYVVKQITGMITGAIGGAIAGPVQGPNLPSPRASGGTVMSNQPYLVGEKGPEIIMPQNRGHVMNADLTAKAMAGGGESVNIVQNFNFSANGDDSVKKLIAQAAPQIASMTQKQIMDSRRRGGAMKSTFG